MLGILKKKILLFFVIVIPAQLIEGENNAGLVLEQDLGYFYGYSFGNMLKEGKSTDVDIDSLVQGMKDSLSGNPPALSDEQKDAIYIEVRRRQALAEDERKRLESEQEALVAETAANNLLLGEAFLEENAARREIRSTASGLQYEVINEKVGSPAQLNDNVVVYYKGTFITGEVFDQSNDEPVQFNLQQVIKGWTEGLQLMSVGDKYRFYLHPNLAYGAGVVGQIPPNSVLIFDIELLDVK